MAAKDFRLRYERFAGVRNDVRDESLEPADLPMAVNVDVADDGQIARRSGYTERIAGSAVHSLYVSPDESIALFMDGQTLYRMASDASSRTAIAAAFTAERPMRYAAWAGRIYLSNAVETGVIDGGALRPWGLEVPAAPAVANGGGAGDPGRYSVAVTAMAADGRESGAGPSATVEVADGGIVVTMPTIVDAPYANIYRTHANGEQLFLAGTVSASTASMPLNCADALTRPLLTQHLRRPPPPDDLAEFAGRLLLAYGNQIIPTQPFSPELVDLRAGVSFEAPVTMLAPADTGLYVGTADGRTHWLNGRDPDGWSASRVMFSAVIPGSLTSISGTDIGGIDTERDLPAWLTPDGFVVGLPGGQLVNLSKRWRLESPPTRAAAVARQNGRSAQLVCSLLGV